MKKLSLGTALTMPRRRYAFPILVLALSLMPFRAVMQTGVTTANFVNFEAAQTNPVRLTPDGTRLLAVNTADARLSVFDLTNASAPALVSEIPVGIEPVSVNARVNDAGAVEAWVVNQVSDSVSIVSLATGIVTDTISVKDEPSDIVFAGADRNLAFVSVSRSNEVRVFDATTHGLVKRIPLAGNNPRALATSADGSKVYVAFALSGNRTTILPADKAPRPPQPTNPALPSAPQTGLIIDAANPPVALDYTVTDNDVAEIDAPSQTVSRYFSGVGTVNLGIAVRPSPTGDTYVYVANTDAHNLERFEPTLRGRFVDNRVSWISTFDGSVSSIDLNPGIGTLSTDAVRAQALAQPTNIVFDPSGASYYVAAFGTDRVARIAADGSTMGIVEIGPAAGTAADPRTKRGPRGLALNAAGDRVYVLNRIANTISIVDTTSTPMAVIAEIPVGSFDPTPSVIRNGRGFLYDAKLSGNGTVSCASCHIDAEMDQLAWDLGNPGGTMQTVTSGTRTFQMHPMKGPMTTQTLRGLSSLEPLHWRGDKADFLAFSPAFDTLMGGTKLSDADMTAYRDFINTVKFAPNPNQNLDRTLPASLAGGDPNAGRNTFLNQPFRAGLTCTTCHSINSQGTNRTIIPSSILGESQDMKVPHLRALYQKTQFTNKPGSASVGGFGFTHDGSLATLFDFLSQPVFGNLSTDTVRKLNVSAFLLSFDTGMAPAVGYARTLRAANVASGSIVSDWSLLEAQAATGNIDLIAKGTIDGEIRGLFYRPTTADYQTDRTGVGPFTHAKLVAKLAANDVLTIMGVPPGTGVRMGIDRDVDGTLDGDVGRPSLPPPPAPVLHVASILTADANGTPTATFSRGDTVFWRAQIVSAGGAAIAGAAVTTDMVFGGVSVATTTSTTGADGWALFSRGSTNRDKRGTYTIRVTAVTAAGATYDATANVKSETTYTLR